MIEALSFALNSAQLLWEENNTASGVTFTNCLLSPNPKNYGSLVVKKRSSGITISDTLKLTDDRSALFNGLLEIIYQVRCQLVHGQLEPSEVNHEVVKQCYFLLHLLMRF